MELDLIFFVRFGIPSILMLLAFILKLLNKDGWGWFLFVGFMLFGLLGDE